MERVVVVLYTVRSRYQTPLREKYIQLRDGKEWKRDEGEEEGKDGYLASDYRTHWHKPNFEKLFFTSWRA